MTEVKQCRARSVLGWETAWEHWVLLASIFFVFSYILTISVRNLLLLLLHARFKGQTNAAFWQMCLFTHRKSVHITYIEMAKVLFPRQRPYHVEHTSSRPITEVKQRRARLVLGWVTAWEYRVL